ncbi:MAG: DUF4347 domain-containing protein, partial [Methylobacter sp.]
MKFIKTMLKEKSGKVNSSLSAPTIDYGSHYKPRRTMMALEPRIMFDGAAAATTADTVADTKPPVQDNAVIGQDAAKLAQAAAESVPPAVQADPMQQQRTEILFVENNVADYQMLIDGAKPGIEVHVLDSGQDGLAQMAQILEGRSGIDAIHIMSHGSEASVGLGSLTLTAQNLSAHAADFETIGQALNPNADILLYGCDIGAGSDGQAFITAIANATKADVAASNDPTGSAARGGDWALEAATGSIEAKVAVTDTAEASYNGLLAAITFDFDANVTGSGTTILKQTKSSETIVLTSTDNNLYNNAASAWGTIGSGKIAGMDSATALVESQIVITVQGGKTFDLTNFDMYDDQADTITVTTNTGKTQTITFNAAGTKAFTPTTASDFQGITSFTITAADNTFYPLFDNIILNNISSPNAAPTLGGTFTTGGTVNDNATTTPFNQVTYTDADGTSYKVKIAYTAANGTLTGTGLSGSAGNYTVTGADAATVQSNLQALVFTPTANQVAPASTVQTTFTLTPNDGTVDGTADSTTKVTATSINDAPTGGNKTVTATEDTTYSFQTGDFTFTDPDAGAAFGGIQMTALPSAGNLWLDANHNGSNDDAALTSSSTVSAADIASGYLKFSPAANANGAGYANFSFKVSDGSLYAAAANTLTIDVSAVNDKPVATAGATQAYTEKAVAGVIDNTITLNDVDDTQITGATVTISAGKTTGDVLAVATQNGISGSYNSGTGVLTLTGTATLADYQAALRSVTFASSSSDPTATSSSRTITWAITDAASTGSNGAQTSTGVTSTINITSVNDAPTLTATTSTPTYTETGASVSLFSSSALSTVETGQTIDQVVFTVSGLADGANEIMVINGTDVALTNSTSGNTATNTIAYSVSVTGSTATVTLTKNDTAANWQGYINALTYKDTGTGAGLTAGNRVVTLTSVKDSGGTANSGVDTTAVSVASTVTVAGINHAPTLSTTTSTPTFTEGGAAVSLFSATTVGLGSPDTGQSITQLVLTVTNVSDGASEIVSVDGSDVALTNANSVTTATNGMTAAVAVSGSTATVTISKAGGISAANMQTLVNGLTYKNSSNNPSVGSSRVVTLTQVKDNGGTSGGGVDTTTLSSASTVSLVAVNNAPT